MVPRASLPALLLLAACGGGGGGGTAAVGTTARLAAEALEIGPGSTEAELVVRLLDTAVVAPVLVEVGIELPPALTIAATEPLRPAQPLTTLDGDSVDGRFVVLCGDARNRTAPPLQRGPLFRLRLTTTVPRQTGTWSVVLRDLRAAAADGTAAAAEPAPTAVPITVR